MFKNKDCEGKSDEELVRLALKNQDYYYCLVSRWENKILRYILKISSATKEDAEDILQDAFISAYKSLNDFDRNLKFSSWIYRIARNKTISFWRKSKIRPKTVSSDDDLELFKLVSGDDDLAKELEKKCDSRQIKNILKNLKEKYREILILKFLEEKSYREISDILKKPMGTVATLLSRAKKKFKKEAMRQGIEFKNL